VTTPSASPVPGHVRLVAFDIDGVFTDGRFYLSNQGVESKSFNTQDGYGIRQLLSAGVEVAIISGRRSAAVDQRMAELGVSHIIQGSRDKIADFDALTATLGIVDSDCVYVGDDIPDLPLLNKVGFSFAVANAVSQVREQCAYITQARGGHGAVREVCDLLLAARAEADAEAAGK
jgi:3-deoxy-D-manno-octulosonate 8-phosphate phosphatase (KDO 8-P phosphatase)